MSRSARYLPGPDSHLTQPRSGSDGTVRGRGGVPMTTVEGAGREPTGAHGPRVGDELGGTD